MKKLVLTIIATLLLTGAVSHAADSTLGNPESCSESLQYFNEELDALTSEELVTMIAPESPNCAGLDHHGPYPAPHIDYIDPTVHTPEQREYHTPFTNHAHKYINQSPTSQDTVAGTSYYQFTYAEISAFEIELEKDALENMDLTTLKCYDETPSTDYSCEGSGRLTTNSGDSFGYKITFDGTKATWTFDDGDKPFISGNNYDLDQMFPEAEYFDSTLESNRSLELAISFKTNKAADEFWSATSTAQVLLQNFQTDVPTSTTLINYNDLEWDEIDDEPYWFEIGTASTIWQQRLSYCKEISIDHYEDIYEGTLSTFTAKSLGDNVRMEDPIQFSVDPGHGTFFVFDPELTPLNTSRFIREIVTTAFIRREAPVMTTINFISDLILTQRKTLQEPGNFRLNSILHLNGETPTGKTPLDSPFTPVERPPSPVASEPESIVSAPEFRQLSGPEIYANQGQTVYFWADEAGRDVIHVKQTEVHNNVCERDFSIVEQNVCASLGLTSNLTPIIAGEEAELTLENAVDTNGDPLPGDTQISWGNSTGGTFSYRSESGPNLTLRLDQSPVTFTGGSIGSVQVGIAFGDSAHSNQCNESLPVTPPLECLDHRLQVNDFISNRTRTILGPNSLSKIEGIPQFNIPVDYSVKYQVDTDIGAFVRTSGSFSILDPDVFRLIALQSANAITADNLIETFGEDRVGMSTVRDAGDKVVLATYSGLTEDFNTDTAITTHPGGFSPEACGAFMEFRGVTPDEPDEPDEPDDPDPELECLDLEIIDPDQPWRFEEGDDVQTVRISATTNPIGEQSQLHFNWKITNHGQWELNDDKLIEDLRGDPTQRIEDFEDGTLVEVWATENPRECSDFITARGETEEDLDDPEMEKFVYPEGRIDDAEDAVVNLDHETSYLTYVLEFTPGDYESVKIREENMNNGVIDGTLSGRLEHKGTRINIIRDGNNEMVHQTTGYRIDPNDRRFTPTRGDFSCDDTNEFCIVGPLDLAFKNFKNGNNIEFKNLDDLGRGGTIIIKYQMMVNSTINEDSCDDLDASTGCGEIFDNKASFIAQADGESFRDDDSAKAIVICPFILNRAGGDVFFYDSLNTGVDVAQCSEVKGSTGPGITPHEPDDPIIPSTGIEDLPEEVAFLDLPSHDICRYSNDEGNIEGYNDVLENFSSTICELRADVAAEWREENINASIAANISRIARWGENLTTQYLPAIPPEVSNGVFIRENGDLVINGLTIKKNGKTPAAQTYIVRGHDLHINDNIYYDTTDFTGNPKNIPSAAFIVIDGDIHIDSNVSKIDGILMAVDLDDDGNGGHINNKGPKSKTRLTISGSLIGNVTDLFRERIAVGDPTKNQGSVTIFYDERILLNTPPGISQLVNLQQTIVPN